MKVLLTGVNGQLGHDLVANLNGTNHNILGTDITDIPLQKTKKNLVFPYKKLDITEKESVQEIITDFNPDAVIHCAAWTAVDNAEDEDNRKKCELINAQGTENISEACQKVDCKLIYISTDYVFDGHGTTPWEPDCQKFSPCNVYGQTKLAGERAVASMISKFFIVRTSWVFGINGNNFVKTMLHLGKKYDTLRVVNDQIGSPTYSFDLARFLIELMQSEKYGFYHAANFGDYISWYDFACEIFRQKKYTTKVIPVSTAEYGLSKANRPFNSRLEKSKIEKNGFTPLPNWKDALKRYLIELDNNA